MPINLNVGDIVQMKKTHPCGNDMFKICRVGMDFRIECIKCNHQIWLQRAKLEKSIKKIIEQSTK